MAYSEPKAEGKEANATIDGGSADAPRHSPGESEGASLEHTLTDAETFWVQFEDDDPENPFNWTKKRKWIITYFVSWITALVAGVGSGFAIGIQDMERDLGNRHQLSLLAITMYPLGFGIVPLVTAPLSETFGRQKLYIASTAIFALVMIPLALAPNITCVLICRFLAGACGSTGSTVVGGSIADIWKTSERGPPMAIFSVAAFVGTGGSVGFLGYVVQDLSWRWVSWLGLISSVATLAGVFVILKETRGSVILSNRAKRLREETGDNRYQCRADIERKSLADLIKLSLIRPLYFLATEPVVQAMTVYIVFAWAILWSLLESIPLIFENVYGFDTGQTGLAFWSLVVGAFAALAANRHQEHLYKKYFPIHGPEARLYYSCVGGIVFVIGGAIVSFAQGRTHWIVPCLGFAFIQFGIFMIYLSVFSYLADAYTLYASSAIAAQSFARNCVGGCFPLFIQQMNHRLTIQWANFLITGLGAILSLIPFLLFWKGSQLRASSKQVQEVARLQDQLAKKRETPASETKVAV